MFIKVYKYVKISNITTKCSLNRKIEIFLINQSLIKAIGCEMVQKVRYKNKAWGQHVMTEALFVHFDSNPFLAQIVLLKNLFLRYYPVHLEQHTSIILCDFCSFVSNVHYCSINNILKKQ